MSSVQRLATLKGIERIDVTHTGKPLTDVSVKATKVSDILNKPAGAATSLTGKGVMVCIIDGGFNFTHAAFADANGNSRIKCVYKMGEKTGKAGHKQLTYTDPKAGEVTAPGYYYDTPEGIQALGEDDGLLDTHGTHTAGIAVGTKSALGFTGMAPEADIVYLAMSPIITDDDVRTNVEDIYAIGDVNGRTMLAHAATYQGIHVVNQILGRGDQIRLSLIPAAIFTHPEAASVGLTEDACKQSGMAYTCHKGYYRANGKALAMDETEGMVKVLADETGRLIGCHVYGAHAADIVQEATALMAMDATLQQLRDLVHIHPTLSEILAEVR